MKFLIDAQLPQKLLAWLTAAGEDATHTLSLPGGNRTTDAEIIAIADRELRVVVTKDADFVDSFSLRGQPNRLLLISTGNLSNDELECLFVPLIPSIAFELRTNSFLELGRSGLTVRA